MRNVGHANVRREGGDMRVNLRGVLLVVAIVLFAVAALETFVGKGAVVDPLALDSAGLAFFAGAHL